MDLLDYLSEKCGAEYISDLRHTDKWKKAIKDIEDKKCFSLNEWNEAISYLTFEKKDFVSIDSAINYLFEYKK